jgi:plastocyanin
VRSRAAAVLAGALALELVVTASLTQAHASKPKRTCHRVHHRLVCTSIHVKSRRPVTSTTTGSAPDPGTGSAATQTTVTTTTSTTATQTATTQTTTTDSSTAAPLPHGTEVDERAMGQQSPFYLLDAYQRTLAAGSIRFNIYNYDQDPHTFAIADSNGAQITGDVQVPAGHTGTPVTLTVNLAPGTYVLFCTLPQHAALGMKTTIVVK